MMDLSTLTALATLLDGEQVSEEERAYYTSLVSDDYDEATSYDEAIGLDDYDVLMDK